MRHLIFGVGVDDDGDVVAAAVAPAVVVLAWDVAGAPMEEPSNFVVKLSLKHYS